VGNLGPFELDTIVVGDCLDVMKQMPDNCIDTIITDPPYGLEFLDTDWDSGVPGVAHWRVALRVVKPGAILMAFGGTRAHHRLMCAIEDAGWEIRDCMMWLYAQGTPKSHNISKAIDKVAHNGAGAATSWVGWGTALKPAWEPIIVAMKPREGTYANNALKWGVAGLWIDGGRVGGADGRWPPNLLLTHDEECETAMGSSSETVTYSRCCPGCPVRILSEQSGERPSAGYYRDPAGDCQPRRGAKDMFGHRYRKDARRRTARYSGDTGTAARFFYQPKSSFLEREEGLIGKLPCVVCGGLDTKTHVGSEGREINCHRNNHPTVKPLALMEYLCCLTRTPSGGIVADPFAGSGSTLLAAKKTGRSYFGCDNNSRYVRIAKARLSAVQLALL